mmetsp:Transcript_9524/g.31108  ORF Transcript_9524/g.31108 Transcript_9524/m.31108 type:complete len:256 (-) Transcript_9524:61-828(-)
MALHSDEAILLKSSPLKGFERFFEKKRAGLWHVRGSLSDPGTGEVYATVRGVEASKQLELSGNHSKRAVAKCFEYSDDHGKHSYAGIITQSNATSRFETADHAITARSKYSGERRLDAYVSSRNEEAPRRKRKLLEISPRSERSNPALARARQGLRCRESYVFDLNDKVLTYSRFGECPAWVGPGKLCALDLTMHKQGPFSRFRLRRRRYKPGGGNDDDFGDLRAEATRNLEALLLSSSSPAAAAPAAADGPKKK